MSPSESLARLRARLSNSNLFVSDQDNGIIVRVPRATPTTPMNFAAVPSPDLSCSGPSGSIFSGSRTGAVYQVSSTGTATVFAMTQGQSRGCAFDEATRTLYVAEHSTVITDAGATAPGAIAVYAVP
jgi:hypothetical protein